MRKTAFVFLLVSILGLILIAETSQLPRNPSPTPSSNISRADFKQHIEDWFEPEDIHAIAVDDTQLKKLGFEKHVNGDGTVKYLRGPFRILIPQEGKFDEMEIWYREDIRHVHRTLGIHELQNFYHQMTKVDLTRV